MAQCLLSAGEHFGHEHVYVCVVVTWLLSILPAQEPSQDSEKNLGLLGSGREHKSACGSDEGTYLGLEHLVLFCAFSRGSLT